MTSSMTRVRGILSTVRARRVLSHPRAARALVLAAVVAFTAQSAAPGVAARDPDRGLGLRAFMIGLACIESGGRYDIVNPVSGAYGKYQIMPFNWPAWAGRYLGDRRAKQTPHNQEKVARRKLRALYAWRGSWRLVAHWWLTGSQETNPKKWSKTSRRYVSNVISIAERSKTRRGRATIPSMCLSRPGDQASRPSVGATRDTRVTTGHVNVRRGPAYERARIAIVLRGTRVTVLDRAKDQHGRHWLKVRTPDRHVGWIASWYTRRP